MLGRMQVVLALLLLCCASVSPVQAALAQAAPAPSSPAQIYTFKSVFFDGAPQYTPAELMTMSGLVTGKPLTETDLQAALRRLDETGLFARIHYKTEGSNLRITLEPIAVSEARTVRYTNFVFYTPAELTAKVHALLPAFTGTIPGTGELEQQVAKALESILRQRGIIATVTSMPGKEGELDYSITTPPVVVGKLVITGIDMDSDPRLKGIRDRAAGVAYVDETSTNALRGSLTDACQDLGFVDCAVGPLTHGIPQVTPSRIAVDLTGAMQTGGRYTIAEITLPAPPDGMTANELNHANQLKIGEPASRMDLINTENRLRQVYEARGYLDAQMIIETSKDTPAHVIRYRIRVVPGEQYRYRGLLVPGLSEEQAIEVHNDFKLPAGAIYDGAALADLNTPSLRRTCDGKPLRVGLRKQVSTHEVDVVATCGIAR